MGGAWLGGALGLCSMPACMSELPLLLPPLDDSGWLSDPKAASKSSMLPAFMLEFFVIYNRQHFS